MTTRRIEIAENLAKVKERIAKAADVAKRDVGEITLIAVTKTFPVSDIEILYELGIRNFGENRDQEGSVKAPELPDDAIWHFQGQIQSNKLKSIVNWADVVHSIDQFSHAQKLDSIGAKKDIFIQVALDQSENRGGIQPSELLNFVESLTALSNLRILGLMAVAPLGEEPDSAFNRLSEISKNLLAIHPGMRAISAGMSNDFEVAISNGATHIRIGSQILGVRQPLTQAYPMANAFRKAANFLGLVDDEEGNLASSEVAATEPRYSRPLRSAPVADSTPSYIRSARAATPVPAVQENAVVDRIITLHPRMYSDVRGIGEHYRLGQPVIMNLSDMEESERKRMIDFASGLVFGHYGSIERVTSKVFLLTPPNVMVSNEDKTAAAQASFFNQS